MLVWGRETFEEIEMGLLFPILNIFEFFKFEKR